MIPLRWCSSIRAIPQRLAIGFWLTWLSIGRSWKRKLKPILDTLRSYQDLPPDKALAALAIEDKKMQYAAADRSILKMYCKQHFQIRCDTLIGKNAKDSCKSRACYIYLNQEKSKRKILLQKFIDLCVDSKILETWVLPQLNQFWPSLTSKDASKENKKLWEHEWNDHGTCSLEVLGAVQYFTVTLKLYQDLKIQDLFTKVKEKLRQEKKLITEASALRDNVLKAIKEIILFKAQIKCKKIGGQEYLLEIRLCYTATKTPKLMDCSKILAECFDGTLHF
ncbi:ribonuclease [Trifolium repens]|nr:ribonuclease [Trifolium repens]